MATPLFSNYWQQQHPQRKRLGDPDLVPGSLLEFKAGRMFREGVTNWVRAELRKGLCYFIRGDDRLLRFCWRDLKTSQQLDDELVMIPGEVVFEKVEQSDERVYVLKFRSSPQCYFFWIQEPDDVDDSDIALTVEVLLSEEQENYDMPNDDDA
ncbi:hypothetical protein GGI12_005877 [Dipsacomyces acuminosporus]|nr:hypothetical protein GGI12_005877 [Dipsacomyces acuminosporus]